MNIIFLAGNSLNNKTWIETVKSEFDTFSQGEILYYNHWQTGDGWIDLTLESQKLADLVKDKTDYFVFAKSIGTVLALKCIYEKSFHPQKAIFCGLPYNAAKQENLSIDDYLNTPSIPTIFIQNEFDPVYNSSDLQEILNLTKSQNYQLVVNPNNHTHDYQDYSKLANLASDFFI